MILIDAEKISASRPDRPLFTDLSLTLETGDRLGVVGINGCGKSTLLRMLSDVIAPEKGVIRRGRGVRVAMLAQEPKLTPGTVLSSTVDGFDESVHWEAEAVLDRLGMGSMFDTKTSVLSGGQAKRVAFSAGAYQRRGSVDSRRTHEPFGPRCDRVVGRSLSSRTLRSHHGHP